MRDATSGAKRTHESKGMSRKYPRPSASVGVHRRLIIAREPFVGPYGAKGPRARGKGWGRTAGARDEARIRSVERLDRGTLSSVKI